MFLSGGGGGRGEGDTEVVRKADGLTFPVRVFAVFYILKYDDLALLLGLNVVPYCQSILESYGKFRNLVNSVKVLRTIQFLNPKFTWCFPPGNSLYVF